MTTGPITLESRWQGTGERCSSTTWDGIAECVSRCIGVAGHEGRHDDGALTWESLPDESTDRTGDVLRDAATDLRADWPWYADALLVMINGLETIAMRSRGPDSYEAASVLEHAKRVAQGERDSVEPLLPPEMTR